MACSRGALNAATRRVDPCVPATWEFSAFSQNGEDGLIWELLAHVRTPNLYFIEIGASNGLENNTSYLAYVKKYNGIMVDGDEFKIRNAERFLGSMNWGVRYVQHYVEPDNVEYVLGKSITLEPDVFSLDIDGNDFHVAEACFEAGFRPKVVSVEYNSAFGPDLAVTIPYRRGFNYLTETPSQVYYGVSVAGWRRFFDRMGYAFVGVDQNGVNAFFIDTSAVTLDVADLQRTEFAENCAQQSRLDMTWKDQFEQIRHLPLVDVA